jgi:hypothetical protein
MIYSTKYCPLCDVPLCNTLSGVFKTTYSCPVEFTFRSQQNDKVQLVISHYEYQVLVKGGIVTMIFPPYVIEHSRYNKISLIYKMAEPYSFYSKKLIFEVDELDWDWSEPYNVVNRIKLLATFS